MLYRRPLTIAIVATLVTVGHAAAQSLTPHPGGPGENPSGVWLAPDNATRPAEQPQSGSGSVGCDPDGCLTANVTHCSVPHREGAAYEYQITVEFCVNGELAQETFTGTGNTDAAALANAESHVSGFCTYTFDDVSVPETGMFWPFNGCHTLLDLKFNPLFGAPR
jgi:hypothetical protein